MFDAILFPTDGSDGADAALDFVLDVAVAHDATLHLLSVADTSRSAVEQQAEVVETLESNAERVVADAAEQARERGIDATAEVRAGAPHSAICDYATDAGVDVVVMPTRGRRGLERFLLGSTTERVVRRSDVPVLTLRPDAGDADYPFESVLVATDGSDGADAALDRGVAVADAEDAALHLLSVVNVTSLGADVRSDIAVDALEQSANVILDDAAARANGAGVDPATREVAFGSSVHRAILDFVDERDADLVVVGTHGRTGFDRYVLGSVAEYLVRTSPVPVLTVRAPETE
ncbi:universal stress protein [Halobacterium litoreum]|uniref:Universal stress protein n=1 Tax=Halobacterium litoreum TaxID=2039234 RepID=A0ABD5NGJ4_9EURY|nr:universal stress protein [Halobacterium litoreum]UHH12705.1 universal stress protein [Halobacterium litoreum]